MKIILVLLLSLTILSCTKDKANSPAQIQPPNSPDGGVDVGNMTQRAIPHTNATMSFPSTWKDSSTTEALILKNSSGSEITAKKSAIKDLVSPTAITLQKYLQDKFPGREYKIIEINGLTGVRAELKTEKDSKQSEIYLLSELKDFIHIETNLYTANDGVAVGERIVLTAAIKYRGNAYENSKEKTIKLNAYAYQGQLNKDAAYSFLDDCYSYVDSSCRGVSVLFGNGGGSYFSVGNAGYDAGRIVDLGKVEDVPFDSIKIEGEYLIAPVTKIPLTDIYTVFTPHDQNKEVDYISLQEGHVYLIRTISWPEEDVITKVVVEKLVLNKLVILKYQKLTYVDAKILQKQVDEINKYTIENEQPLNEGEMTLYNGSISGNYPYSSFNFEYSTTGNMFITRNSWDISFGYTWDGKQSPALSVPHTGGALGMVFELGDIDIKSVDRSLFPDPNNFVRKPTAIQAGKTYGIYHHRYNDEIGAIYGAVKVLEISPDFKWVRLKFRRVHLGPAEHFQKWIDLAVPETTTSVKLEMTNDYKSRVFYPFINKTGLDGFHYNEDFSFEYMEGSDWGPSRTYFRCDYRPYGKDRGFALLPSDTNIADVTIADVEKLKGQMTAWQDVKPGEVFVGYMENFMDKTVFVARVEKVEDGKSIQFTMRYLQRQKAPYSDNKD